MNQGNAEFVEIFLQEASDRLQFLREYSIVLQDEYPAAAEIERLYIAAHTLTGTSASYGFPLFSQVAGKLAHIFQYAMNAPIAPDAAAPLLEFISEAVALLESDLIIISTTAAEAEDDISAFKQRYPFAFQETPPPQPDAVADEEPLELEASAPAQETEVAVQTLETLPPDDEVSPEILEFFVPEAEEHLQVVTECLLAIESAPDQEQLHRLLRSMHTIKGSAAQVGLHRISAVAHRVEDLLGHVRDGKIVASPSVIDVCLNTVDVLKKFLYRQWQSEEELQAAVQLLFSRIDRLSSMPAASAEVAEAGQEGTTEPPLFDAEEERLMAEYAAARAFVAEVAKAEAPEKPEDEPQRKDPAGVLQPKSVRVDLERLDRMMNAVGELVINRTRMVGRISELERLADVLNHSKARMQEKVAEFQEKHEFSRIHTSTNRPFQDTGLPGLYSSHLRPPDHPLGEFTELEMDRYDDFNILSRSLTEISADITEVLNQLDGFVRRVDTDIDEFTKLAHRLQDEITQARMVPIGNLYTRLTRTVRDAAKAAGKRADLVLEGENTELDNNIIQQISDPLIHLVRNAVAHGIESEEARYEAGKSDTGRITVRAYHRGNHIFIEVEDDGGGIDYDGVRKLAVERGLVYAENASDLSEPELLEMLFQPGFSTASRKTELAGRGVGLDVVRSNLAQLNGEIEVHSEKGLGTRFTLKVPLTLIISQALFVRCNKTMFAMPLTFVEEIRRVRVEDVEEVGGKLLTRVRDSVTEVVRMDTVLGLEPVQPINGFYRMVIVNATGRQVGVIVEDVVRKDEIVIKSLGPYLHRVRMFPGATIAPDGSLILLVDVNRLVAGEAMEHKQTVSSGQGSVFTPPNAARIFNPGAEAVAKGRIPQEAIDFVQEEKVVVLVDDSISVRKFVGRMLEKAGYRVKLAADGLEALEIVAQVKCDLVITDLEMPRTNGYELLAHMRQNPETREIPVMVVTSRAGAKHRDRAIKDGASAFLTKPVQEDHFVAAVSRLIGAASTGAKVGALQ